MTDNFSKPFRMPESVPPTPELAAQLQKLAHTVSHPMRGAGLLLEKDGSTRILTALSDERFPGSAGMPPAEISWSSCYRNLEESGERLNPETPVETAGGRRVDLSRFFEHSAPAWASSAASDVYKRQLLSREGIGISGAALSCGSSRALLCPSSIPGENTSAIGVRLSSLKHGQERRSHLKPERLARPIRSGHLRAHS